MNRNFLTFSLLACGKNVISVFFFVEFWNIRLVIAVSVMKSDRNCSAPQLKLLDHWLSSLTGEIISVIYLDSFYDNESEIFKNKKKKKWRFLFFKSFWFHNNCHNCPKLWSSSFVVFNNSVLIFLVKSKQINGESAESHYFP